MRMTGVAAVIVITVRMRVRMAVSVTDNVPVILRRRSHHPILRKSRCGTQPSERYVGLIGQFDTSRPRID